MRIPQKGTRETPTHADTRGTFAEIGVDVFQPAPSSVTPRGPTCLDAQLPPETNMADNDENPDPLPDPDEVVGPGWPNPEDRIPDPYWPANNNAEPDR